MKTSKIYGSLMMLALASLLSCNNSNSNPGQTTTPDGTQQHENSINSDMEDNRTSADVDTVTSPGSNSENIRNRTGSGSVGSGTGSSGSGTSGTDANMQNQSDTHGRDTKSGV